MDTIIFYVSSSEDSVNSVKFLVDDIKERSDANHRLYFRFLMPRSYLVSLGCEDEKGEKHFVGNHEIIFIPKSNQADIDRLKETKNVIWYKNCMVIAGNSEKKKELRQKLINWLLEMEDFKDGY